MAIPMLIPAVAMLIELSVRDHPHRHVSLGMGKGETASGEHKFACVRMEAKSEADEASPAKKMKKDGLEAETILKQTAEIEMVLVGMAALRGDASPTAGECRLAVKAYANLERLIECAAPHDLVSKESLQSLIQQFTVSQQPTLPLVSTRISTLILAQGGSTSSTATPASVKVASTPGPRSMNAAKAAAKLGVSTSSITRSNDLQIVPVTVTVTGERVEKGQKPFLQGRGASSAQPDSDYWSLEKSQQIALEIQLSKPDVFMAPLPETAGAYINLPFRCSTCTVLMDDTSSVLICDGCEVGFHLLCLQMNKYSDVPKKNWYCTKCLAVSRGQPRHSIYGLLRRGSGRRGSTTAWILKSFSAHQSTKLSEYRLKLRNISATRDGENLGAAKSSSVVLTSKDIYLESSSRTL